MNDTRTCLADIHCKAYDRTAGHAYPTDQPLCDTCLDHAEPDVRSLVFDYLDLAQLHEASMSQAITEKTGGSKEKQMLLVGHVEALQAEIVHVLTTWEYEVRVAARLSDPTTLVPVADWHTTISRPVPDPKVRAGALVQRATTILAPRLTFLSRLPATAVCPRGVEDDPVDVAGWEAVLQLADLHRTCRSVLGRTRRTLSLYGTCPRRSCRAEALYRHEPSDPGDEPPVWCDACKTERSYDDYEHFMLYLAWPPHPDDEAEEAAEKAIAA